MSVQRNPKDSMKSTWQSDTDRSHWTHHHWAVHLLGIHPTSLDREIPKHDKKDRMAYLSHWSSHIWIFLHAVWPLVLHQAYINYYGKNLHPLAAFVFYTLAFVGNAVHQLRSMKDMGHKHGFLDGDKHERDHIPDHSVNKVVRALMSTAAGRPLMCTFLAWRTSQGPTSMSWWVPVEIGLYGVILDFWFYWYHRVMHEVDFLWKFHRTHHLTKHPSPLLTLYADSEQEIFDIAIIPLLTYGTLKLMGFPMGFYDWWMCHQYIVFTELFGHSGVRVYATPPTFNTFVLRSLGVELATEDHDLHHRQGWKKSMNYGKQTLVWDTLFGTRGDRIEMLEGVIDFDYPAHLRWWGV